MPVHHRRAAARLHPHLDGEQIAVRVGARRKHDGFVRSEHDPFGRGKIDR